MLLPPIPIPNLAISRVRLSSLRRGPGLPRRFDGRGQGERAVLRDGDLPLLVGRGLEELVVLARAPHVRPPDLGARVDRALLRREADPGAAPPGVVEPLDARVLA